jgi:hypothetical protein
LRRVEFVERNVAGEADVNLAKLHRRPHVYQIDTLTLLSKVL